jgi:hypothetical protein
MKIIDIKQSKSGLTIKISKSYLKHLVKTNDLYYDKITNPDGLISKIEDETFLEEFVHELETEIADDGTTELHYLIDKILRK